MAKTKAELESDFMAYHEGMRRVRAAHRAGSLHEAVMTAVALWEYIDGMMQYAKRYDATPEQETIESIEYVLRYAPVLFDRDSLDKLESLLKTYKRIDKNTTADIAGDLAKARWHMTQAQRLWELIEREGGFRQDELRTTLGGDQTQWRWIAETWERAEILQRAPSRGSYELVFATRLTGQAAGKCPSCGAVGKAKKATLLEPITCPKCRRAGTFVLIAAPATKPAPSA